MCITSILTYDVNLNHHPHLMYSLSPSPTGNILGERTDKKSGGSKKSGSISRKISAALGVRKCLVTVCICVFVCLCVCVCSCILSVRDVY
jgi:hypothetical protein